MNLWAPDKNDTSRRMNLWAPDKNDTSRRMNLWAPDKNDTSCRMNLWAPDKHLWDGRLRRIGWSVLSGARLDLAARCPRPELPRPCQRGEAKRPRFQWRDSTTLRQGTGRRRQGQGPPGDTTSYSRQWPTRQPRQQRSKHRVSGAPCSFRRPFLSLGGHWLGSCSEDEEDRSGQA
jgi:hypothetical protein